MTRQKHYVLYVPGIKDDLLGVQSLLIQCWRLQGVRPVRVSMPWRGQGAYEPKLARLVSKIDTYRQQGHIVSLVGASAGASAVLNAYSNRKDDVKSVAYICGKINRPEAVSKKLYAENAAFRTSLLALQETVKHLGPNDKSNLHSFYSPADHTVPHKDTVISGVPEQKLIPVSHAWAILYALSFGSGKLLRTIK